MGVCIVAGGCGRWHATLFILRHSLVFYLHTICPFMAAKCCAGCLLLDAVCKHTHSHTHAYISMLVYLYILYLLFVFIDFQVKTLLRSANCRMWPNVDVWLENVHCVYTQWKLRVVDITKGLHYYWLQCACASVCECDTLIGCQPMTWQAD